MATTKKPMATDVFAGFDSAFKTQKEMFENFTKMGQETAQKSYDQAIQLTQDNVAKFSDAATKQYDELSAAQKEAFDALLQAGTTMAKGFEQLSKDNMAFAKTALEDGVAASRKLVDAKSIEDVIAIQQDYAKGSYERMTAELKKTQDAVTKVANDTVQPLQTRFTAVVEKAAKPIAVAAE